MDNNSLYFIFVVSLLAILKESIAKVDYGYSSYCQRCITPCALDGKKGKYQCGTYDYTFDNKVYNWDYCSLSATTEYTGQNCTSACAFHGETYQWCSYKDTWGHCSGSFCNSQKEELPDYGYSTYCQSCITPCDKVTSKYYWCSTTKWIFKNTTYSWDYCSPNYSVDYVGNSCLNKCKFRGQDYQSCHTKEGGNGYCTGQSNILCNFLPYDALA